jgi:hypothetical protein
VSQITRSFSASDLQWYADQQTSNHPPFPIRHTASVESLGPIPRASFAIVQLGQTRPSVEEPQPVALTLVNRRPPTRFNPEQSNYQIGYGSMPELTRPNFAHYMQTSPDTPDTYTTGWLVAKI